MPVLRDSIGFMPRRTMRRAGWGGAGKRRMLPATGGWSLGLAPAGAAVIGAFLLGLLHGIVPDEHTWPITFSYAIGGASGREGLRAGILFSAAFTLQRALASELSWFAFASLLLASHWTYAIAVLVGLVMLGSGGYVLLRLRQQAPGPGHAAHPAAGRAMPRWMPLVHGFIAGWGAGGFALILYTTLAPAMGSPYLAWIPGALFGLGTMVAQALIGGAVGAWMARRRLPATALAEVAARTAGSMLAAGGVVFAGLGAWGLAAPASLERLSIETPLDIHNLRHIDPMISIGVGLLLPIGLASFWFGTRAALRTAAASGHGNLPNAKSLHGESPHGESR